MKIDLSVNHFQELVKKSYSLDHIYLLSLLNAEEDIEDMIAGSIKIDNLYQALIRKGLITTENKLTLQGKQILGFLETEEETKIVKVKVPDDTFDMFWKAFPGTDSFNHRGKQFNGSRALRTAKEQCKTKFKAILNEGEYTAKELTEALEYDVLQKKESSVKTGTNKLSFLQNSLTYLNQRSFEPFIELIKEGATISTSKEQVIGSTDI